MIVLCFAVTLSFLSLSLSFSLSTVSLMGLLEQIGSAYRCLCNYDLGMAVQLFQSLPAHQRETAWVKGQVARAYFAGERFKKVQSYIRTSLFYNYDHQSKNSNVVAVVFYTCSAVGHL